MGLEIPTEAVPVIALLVYYVVLRMMLRSDVRTDSVPVQYEPPDGLSPAELRLAECGFTDATSIAATVAQMARKGAIEAVKREDDSFLLVRKVPLSSAILSGEERVTLDKLFSQAFGKGEAGGIEGDPDQAFAPLRSTVLRASATGEDAKRMSATSAALHEIANKAVAGKYYSWNFRFVLFGMAATLGYGLWNAERVDSREPLFFLTSWFFFFAQMATALMALNATKMRLWKRPTFLVSVVIFWGLFLAVPGFVAKKLMADIGTGPVMAFSVMMLLNSVFTPMLRTPTKAGVELRTKIAGYRQFLQSVAADKLDRLAESNYSPTSDEHLAYAIALDVDERWGDALERAAMAATSCA